MSKIHQTDYREIFLTTDRQREDYGGDAVKELADSIDRLGLIHAVVLRRDEEDRLVLVAGGRRLEAMKLIWNIANRGIRHAGAEYAVNHVPFTFLGDIDPLEAFEIELEENIKRKDLTWQERATATGKLFDMRKARAVAEGKEPLTIDAFTSNVSSTGLVQGTREEIRTNVVLAGNLDEPEVLVAKTPKDAIKALRKVEQARQAQALAVAIGETFSRSDHTLLQGSCLEHMLKMSDGTFDVILTDPPYGMGADTFDDGGGAQVSGAHKYDDSYDSWKILMEGFFTQMTRICKPEAHLYLFCDFRRYEDIEAFALLGGWKSHRTPMIWHNPNGNRVPWPDQGPMRKYQCIFYAVRGNKRTQMIRPDVLIYPTDTNLGHNAQKPVALYKDLLERSVLPGNAVIDPFCGTGPIFAAGHDLKCRVTGVELEPTYAGIAAKRLEELL